MDEAGFCFDDLNIYHCSTDLSLLYLRPIPIRVFVFVLYQTVCNPTVDIVFDHPDLLLQEKIDERLI